MTICIEFIASLIQDNDDDDDDYSFMARVCNVFVPLNPTTLGDIMNVAHLDENEYDVPYNRERNVPPANELAIFLWERPSEWDIPHIQKRDIHKDHDILWLIITNAIQPTSIQTY